MRIIPFPRETIAPRNTTDRASRASRARASKCAIEIRRIFVSRTARRESEVARFLTYGDQSCATDLRREPAMSRLDPVCEIGGGQSRRNRKQKEISMSKYLKFMKFLALHALMISIIAIEEEYLFLQDLILYCYVTWLLVRFTLLERSAVWIPFSLWALI